MIEDGVVNVKHSANSKSIFDLSVESSAYFTLDTVSSQINVRVYQEM
jgi:hypothetical protein